MKVMGGILLAIGILIAGGSGLCSLIFLVSMMGDGDISLLGIVLIVGGIPFAIGFGLIMGGRALIRKANES